MPSSGPGERSQRLRSGRCDARLEAEVGDDSCSGVHLVGATASVLPAALDEPVAQDVLGFRHYEGIVLDDGSEAGAWLSLSIAAHELIYVADARRAQGRLHHLSFWVDTREEVLRAADVMIEHLVPIEFAPSKHTISQGFFLYVFEPGGNRIEITSGGYLVCDPDQEPVLWTQAERARGQAWEVKTVENFRYYGTPPAHEDDRAYVAHCRLSMPSA